MSPKIVLPRTQAGGSCHRKMPVSPSRLRLVAEELKHWRQTMSICRARPSILAALGLGIAILGFSLRPAVQSRADQKKEGVLLPGAVQVHTAVKHDLSPPLASQQAFPDEPAGLECEGLA